MGFAATAARCSHRGRRPMGVEEGYPPPARAAARSPRCVRARQRRSRAVEASTRGGRFALGSVEVADADAVDDLRELTRGGDRVAQVDLPVAKLELRPAAV